MTHVTVVDIVGNSRDNKFAPYQRMANAIIEVTQKHGECTLQNLWTLGFTKEETRDCWHMAHAMASVELKLSGNGESGNFCLSGEQYA